MTKIKKSQKHIHSAPGTKKNEKKYQWVIPSILIMTAIAFLPVLSAGFITLDDNEYVTTNPYLKTDLKLLLTTPLQGNYHPLTMLSLWINHLLSGENALSYHLFNLVFHLINCFLVFRLVMLLSRNKTIIAFTTAILFGIHPMHVESVAWVSERKDVLYGLFFLAGLISYLKYIDTNSRKQYLLTILFLVLSLLSKPAAVIFPAALLCIDFFRSRKLTSKLILEKAPFFILAGAMGILTLVAQREAGATGAVEFGIVNRILFGFYGIMMYIVKLFAPFNLSAFYSFPAVNQSLPVAYYIGPLFFVGLAVLFWYTRKNYRVIAFGILFFLINLLLVLQLLPVGGAVMSERYTYIPYIGLFYIAGWLIDRYASGNISKANYIIVPVALFFSVLTFLQASVWRNSATFWDHIIKVEPSAKAYANRAMLYRDEGKYDLAIDYYNKALQLNVVDYEAYGNRGNVYFSLNKADLAIKDYKKALSLKPDYHPSLDNLGAQYAKMGQFDSAFKYSTLAINVKPEYKPAYSNRALTLMELKRYDEAIKDWEKFLQFEPGAFDIYNIIGSCYQQMGKYQESVASITRAIESAPSNAKDPAFYLNRAISYNALKKTDEARQDALKAKQGGVALPADLAKSLGME